MIRNAAIEDAGAICEIYNHYVLNTLITFEEKPVSLQEMQGRIADITSSLPWYVAEENGKVTGYAYANKWKSRSAYRFAVESSIYIHPDFIGKGLGIRLYESLIVGLRNLSIHAVIGGITMPNDGSVALHERLGFTKVAHFKEVGWKFGRWIDVGYWELILENPE